VSDELPTQLLVLDGTVEDLATKGLMARYEVARCQSARDLLLSCGGIEGDPAICQATEQASVLPDMSTASVGVRIAAKIRTLVRLVNVACRWAYGLVAL
jgi:hypothetical protein